MKRFQLTPLIIAAAMVCAQVATAQNSNQAQVQQKFVSGGTIRLHLEAGAYTIEGGDSTDIVATYTADTMDQLKHIRVIVKTSGSEAEVWVKGTPHSNFHATIEIPRLSNLWTRLSAGDLDIKGIEGDKDVRCRAGDVNIEVAHPEDYSHREASVLAGDIDASAFNVTKDGLWRSFKQDGPGKYRLQVHLTAGDITLRGPS